MVFHFNHPVFITALKDFWDFRPEKPVFRILAVWKCNSHIPVEGDIRTTAHSCTPCSVPFQTIPSRTFLNYSASTAVISLVTLVSPTWIAEHRWRQTKNQTMWRWRIFQQPECRPVKGPGTVKDPRHTFTLLFRNPVGTNFLQSPRT